MNTYTLADAPLGTPVRVVCIHNQGVEMRSPLADPTAYRVRDALIALRRAQAVQIEVAVVEAGAIQ